MAIRYTNRALRGLRNMPRRNAETFMTAFRQIADDPRRRDIQIVRLQGRAGYRIRAGEYRAIFEWNGEDIVVLDAGPRGSIYRRRQ
jgi:mRNA interferase RelE/StbE